MGSKRIGLARTQALLENLKRQLAMGDSTLAVKTLTAAEGVTATTGGLTVTAGGLTVTAGTTHLRGTGGVIRYQGAEATSADDTSVVTAANVLAGIVKCTPGAARAKATDTAANFVSGLGLTADGDSFDFSFINLATTASYIVTLTAGTGITLLGSPLINPRVDGEDTSGSATFRVRRTGATAVTIYRLG